MEGDKGVSGEITMNGLLRDKASDSSKQFCSDSSNYEFFLSAPDI